MYLKKSLLILVITLIISISFTFAKKSKFNHKKKTGTFSCSGEFYYCEKGKCYVNPNNENAPKTFKLSSDDSCYYLLDKPEHKYGPTTSLNYSLCFPYLPTDEYIPNPKPGNGDNVNYFLIREVMIHHPVHVDGFHTETLTTMYLYLTDYGWCCPGRQYRF